MIDGLGFEARWNRGITIDELAAIYGCSEAEILRTAKRLRLWTDVRACEHAGIEDRLIALYATGDWTLHDLEGHFSISANKLRLILTKAGYDPSTSGAHNSRPMRQERQERQQAMMEARA